jgi:predicted aminopeptidase
MAAPKTELKPYTWWYLFVGRVPYKGFPSEESAKVEADRFAAQGYDTHIRQAAAFSTLGWFDDPLLAHLLHYDKVTLAEIVFHELLHNTFFVKGAVDFNESLANFVGYRAAMSFFRDHYGANSKEYLRAVQVWDQELEFAKFLAELVLDLKHLYAEEIGTQEKLRLREEMFARSQARWISRTANDHGHRHAAFGREKLNNAVLSHHLLYSSHLDLFESVYEASGSDLRLLVESIVQRVNSSTDPFAAVRGLLVQEPARSAGFSAPLR